MFPWLPILPPAAAVEIDILGMRKILKLLFLAALVYGGWWVWKNYDLPGWYAHVKNAVDRRDTRSALVLPNKKGESFALPNTISIKDGCEFSTDKMEIKKGERVVWENISGAEQQIVGVGFDLKIIPAGRTFIKTFNEVGNFYFNCADNEQLRGQIIVK